MRDYRQFYINGQWVDPLHSTALAVINPATEDVCAQISLASEQDVDAAVKAAATAFSSFSQTSREQRIALLQAIIDEYKNRFSDIADAIREEMGAPLSLATKGQTIAGLGHLKTALKVLQNYSFVEQTDACQIFKEPIGVCGLITPWNWPMNQITCKVAPALATGCTMVLKPSEIAPLSGYIFAQIMHKAGVPAGVFNLINGDGATAGTALSKHPLVDMMSFTGSTRAGALVAQNAAPSIKRVTQELGGKSANIILDDADLETAVKQCARSVFSNTGQSCNAPTRLLVPQQKMQQAAKFAAQVAAQTQVGDPSDAATDMGPLVSDLQFKKVQALIQQGIDEGAHLVCGGVGRPANLIKGYYVKPTVFSQVNNQMTIAQQEIFGPVLCIIPYQDEQQAVQIANDTPYGLAGYIQGKDMQRVAQIARQIRAGTININGQSGDLNTPFGGYKQSGNGRECGAHGFADFLEIKAVSGLGSIDPLTVR